MPNVFFFYGNDEFGISRRLKEFEGDFPDPTSADMNIARLDARTMTEEELNTAVNAMPFLAPRRLVLLANPSGRYIKPTERKRFEAFIEKVPETARLIIYEGIEPKEVERHWLVRWAEKRREMVKTQAFMLPRQKEMAGWIINETKNQGGGIEPAAAGKLAEMVGVNTRQAGQEIAKLLAYVNWERQVKTQDVEAVSIVTSQESIFDFVDALAAGDRKKAQHRMHRLLEDDDIYSLWGMVVRQFRLLLQTREVLDAHGGKDEVVTALGVIPFVAEKMVSQARAFTMPALEKIYHRLLQIDEDAKTGESPLDIALDTLVVELSSE